MWVELEFRVMCQILPGLAGLDVPLDVTRDAWRALQQPYPDLDTPLLAAVGGTETWQRLRGVTVGDGLVAALATIILEPMLIEADRCGVNVETGDLTELDPAGGEALKADLSLLESFGYSNGSDPERLDRLEQVRSSALAPIIRIMRRIPINPGDGFSQVPAEIVGVTVGDDVANVLPSELALLADPDSEIEFYRRYVTKELLRYEVRRNRNNPVVLVRDTSGSMREVQPWAAAVSLAAMQAAFNAGRRFVGIVFSDQVEVFRFPGDDVFEFAVANMCGGTNYPLALRTALDEGGDLIFVTDGEFYEKSTIEWFNNERKRLGVACHGVGMNRNVDGLRPWCDTVTAIESLRNNKTAERILEWCR